MPQTKLIDKTDDDVLSEGNATISVAEARRLVELFAKVTTSRNAIEFASGFTEDCIVRFNCDPEIHGREEVEAYFSVRFGAMADTFCCKKTLRTISGNVLGVQWRNTWIDIETGLEKEGRGSEFWIMRGDKIARWDAVYTQ